MLLSLASVLLLSGCNQGIMTLKNLSAEQEAQHAYIKRQEALFSSLKEDVADERLQKGTPKARIISRYGDPILCRQTDKDGAVETCLFRHPTEYFSSDQIWLYFDKNNKLLNFRSIPAEK